MVYKLTKKNQFDFRNFNQSLSLFLASGFCPSVDWIDHHASGLCYRLYLAPVNYTEAKSSCDLISGTLNSAKTINESLQLLPVINNGTIWSQYKLVMNNGVTTVQDGDSAKISNCVECNNLIGSIGNQSFTSICLVINFNSNQFNWMSSSCSDKYSYLCEYESGRYRFFKYL